MKNKLLILTTLCALLFSCKKSSVNVDSPGPVTDSAAMQSVSFNLSGFSGGTEPLSSTQKTVNAIAVSALKDQVKYLYYFAYAVDVNTAITLKKKIVQKSTDAGFGTIKDVLPSGKYKIYFFGGQAEGDAKLVNKNTGAGPLEPIFYYKDSVIHESFWKKMDLVVNSTKDTSVVLTRAVSKITVKLTDAIPQEAATIKMHITDFPIGYDLDLGNGEPRGRYSDEYYPTKTFTYVLNSGDKGKTNYTISEFVWPFAFADITIDSYNGAGALISSKKLPKNFNDVLINVKRNTNYIFTGKLYQSTNTFTVSADTTWNAPITKPFSVNN
jgi:hypothetical protein